MTILQAFETAGWPPRIDDSHGRKPTDETWRRDMANLNKLIRVPIIRSECDGNGTGFLWKSLPQPRATKVVKATKAAKRRKK